MRSNDLAFLVPNVSVTTNVTRRSVIDPQGQRQIPGVRFSLRRPSQRSRPTGFAAVSCANSGMIEAGLITTGRAGRGADFPSGHVPATRAGRVVREGAFGATGRKTPSGVLLAGQAILIKPRIKDCSVLKEPMRSAAEWCSDDRGTNARA
jgi:hypothetical protein